MGRFIHYECDKKMAKELKDIKDQAWKKKLGITDSKI